MIFYSYDEFSKDVEVMAKELKEYGCDTIVAIARGGMTLGHFLAEHLSIRNLYSLNSIHYDHQQKLEYIKVYNIPDLSKAKKVVIVDDIIDSGETMYEITRLLQERFPQVEFKNAAIFYKPTSIIKPDFAVKEAQEWIEFFWSKAEN